MPRLKAALIRDPEAPAGQPARVWLNCECGRELDMTNYARLYDRSARCECGIVYDAQGWIISG